MKVSKTGLDLVKKWEGGPWLTAKRFMNEKYLSIGFGHYGPDVKMGMKITKQQAEDLLKKDLQKAEKAVNKYQDKYKFNQNEYDALVSFAYNIGNIDQLTKNGTRTKKQIADNMLKYVNAGGKVLPGLVNRRKDEQKLFLKSAEPKKKTDKAIAKEVIAGKWGNGSERKKKLTEAGYDYSAIQKLVNEMIKG